MFAFFSRRAAPAAPPPPAPVVVPVVAPRPWVPGEWSLNATTREHAYDDSRQLVAYGALPEQSLFCLFLQEAQAKQEAALVASRCWS